MNKTKYIILSIALCFSLVLVAYSLRASADVNIPQSISPSTDSGLIDPNPINAVNGQNVTTGDILSSAFPDPNTTVVEDQFTGPSGTNYVCQPTGDTIILNGVVTPVVIWVPVSTDTGGTITTTGGKEKGWRCPCDGGGCREHISTSPQYSTLAQCEQKCPCGIYKYCNTKNKCQDAVWYKVNPGDQCKVDADCQTPTKYSCNTSTWTCSTNSAGDYTSLATCQANCVATPIPGGCPSGQTKPHRECR